MNLKTRNLLTIVFLSVLIILCSLMIVTTINTMAKEGVVYAETTNASYVYYKTSGSYYYDSTVLANCTIVTANETFASGGSFVVRENVTINSDVISNSGLTIIIDPGCTLTINGRLVVNGDFKVYAGATEGAANLVLGDSISAATLSTFSSSEDLGLYWFKGKTTIDTVRVSAYSYEVDKPTVYIEDTAEFKKCNFKVYPKTSATNYNSYTANHMIQVNADYSYLYGANIEQVNETINYMYAHIETCFKTSGQLYLYENSAIRAYRAVVGVEATNVISRSGSVITFMGDRLVTGRDLYGIKANYILIKDSRVIIQDYDYGMYSTGGIEVEGFASDLLMDSPDTGACAIKSLNYTVSISGGKIKAIGKGAGGISCNRLDIEAAYVYAEDLVLNKGIEATKITLTSVEIVGKDTAADDYTAVSVTDAETNNYTARPIMKVGMTPVHYVEYNTSTKEYEDKTVEYYKILDEYSTFNVSGWYVVNSNLENFMSTSDTHNLDINIIVCDGSRLDILGNIDVRTLKVYGQTEGTGILALGTEDPTLLDSDDKAYLVNNLTLTNVTLVVNVRPISLDNITIDMKSLYVNNDFNMYNSMLSLERWVDSELDDFTELPNEITLVDTKNFTAIDSSIVKGEAYSSKVGINVRNSLNFVNTSTEMTELEYGIIIDATTSTDAIFDDSGLFLTSTTADGCGIISNNGNIILNGTVYSYEGVGGALSAVNGDISVNGALVIATSTGSHAISAKNLALTNVSEFTISAPAANKYALDLSVGLELGSGVGLVARDTDDGAWTAFTNYDAHNNYVMVGSAYEFDSFVWDANNTTARAKFVNKDDAQDIKYEDATMTNAVQTPATCGVNGTTRYTATYGERSEYKDVQDIPALEHDYVFDSIVWGQTYSTAKAKLICSHDATHISEEDVQVVITTPTEATLTTTGVRRYTVTYKGHTEYKEVTIPVKKAEIEKEDVTVKIDGEDMFDGDIDLRVEVKTEVKAKETQVDYAKVQAKLDKKESIIKVYDVKLIRTVNGVEEEIQPSDIKEGTKITVRMKVPQGVEAGTYRVLHIHSVDDMEFIDDFTLDGDEIVFEIDRFSEFAFIAKGDSHGFCIGWIVFIFVILELLATCLYVIIRFGLCKELVAKCKLDCLYGKMNLLTFIGLCVSGAIFLFALIVLCVHVCAISIISFILALLICLVYTYFFVVDHDVLKLLKGEKKEEDVKEVEEVKDEPKAEEIKDVKDAEEEDTAIAETEAEAEKEYESEKDDTLEEIEAKEKAHEALTLKDSLVLAKATSSSHTFSKKFIADYLRTKDIVEVNERDNYTRTGLPLADTHYVDGKEGKKCFTYVYETEGSIILLAKMDSKYAEKLQEKHSQINLSAFPKQKNTWYSLILDDTYTAKEVEGILDELIGEVKEDAGMSLKESIALAKANTSHSFSKKYVCDYLKDKPNVEVNTRENYTKTGLPLADTHFVEKDGKKICFAYIYEIEGSIILLAKMNTKYANALKKKHPNVTLSAFPKQADTWYSLIIDGTYTKEDFDKIIDDLIEQA